jgi:Xaa-Pro aminopeptidase
MLLSALRVFQLRLLPTRFLSTRHGPYRSLSTMGTIDTQTVDTTDRLAALRKHMAEHNVGAYIVPSEDQRKILGPSDWRPAQYELFPDFSEYPAECDNRRAFISGFNGSAGLLVAQS